MSTRDELGARPPAERAGGRGMPSRKATAGHAACGTLDALQELVNGTRGGRTSEYREVRLYSEDIDALRHAIEILEAL